MNEEDLKSEIYKLFPENKEIKIETSNRHLLIYMIDENEKYNFFIELNLHTHFITVLNYAVAFEFRGKGIGSKLWDIFEEYIKSLGYKEIYLHLVLTSAEKFWIKKGFIKENHTWKKLLT